MTNNDLAAKSTDLILLVAARAANLLDACWATQDAINPSRMAALSCPAR